MAKVLLFGDLHYRAKHTVMNEQITLSILNIINKTIPDAVILLGDIGDSHDVSRVTVFKAIYNLLYNLNVKTYIIIGNHDLPGSDPRYYLSTDHFFLPYKKWGNLVIVDKPIWFEIKDSVFIACPFTPPGYFIKTLNMIKDVNWKLVTAIFAHQEILGCSLGKEVSTKGDRWNSKYPHLYTGHIHDAQEIGNNVHFIGSFTQVAINENPDKYAWLIDFSKDEPWVEKFPSGIKNRKPISLSPDQLESQLETLANLVQNYEINLTITPIEQQEYFKLKKEQFFIKLKKLGINITPQLINNPVYEKTSSKLETFAEILDKKVEKKKCKLTSKAYFQIVQDLK